MSAILSTLLKYGQREMSFFLECRCIMGLQRKDAGSRMSLSLQRPPYFIYM